MNLNYDEITKTSREFRDVAGDLLRSGYNGFNSALNFFKSFCEESKVIQEILTPIIEREFDTYEWYQNAISSQSSFRGSGNATLPNNRLDAYKVAYDLLWDENALGALLNFGHSTMFKEKYDDQIKVVNNYLSNQLIRYIIRELEDKIELDKPQSQQQIQNWQFNGPANVSYQSQNSTQSIQLSNHELKSLVDTLRETVTSSQLTQESKEDALDTVNMIDQETSKKEPSKKSLIKLVGLLPQIDKIVTSSESIIQHIDKFFK